MTTLEALTHLKQARKIWPGCELNLIAGGESWRGTITIGNGYGSNELPPSATFAELNRLSLLLDTIKIVVTGSLSGDGAYGDASAALMIEVQW